MDTYFRQENLQVFKRWVYLQVSDNSNLTIEEYDPRTYKIYYKKRVARFVIWPNGMIEESIHEDDKLLFYLHYKFYNFHFATDLFYRMIAKLTEEKTEKKEKVLLCCTGGMTTGFFAEKMNKFCELNQLDYIVEATSEYNLPKVYQDYHLVLLAPQLRFKLFEFSQKFKPTAIKSIDPVIFATYDCPALLKVMNEYYENEGKT